MIIRLPSSPWLLKDTYHYHLSFGVCFFGLGGYPGCYSSLHARFFPYTNATMEYSDNPSVPWLFLRGGHSSSVPACVAGGGATYGTERDYDCYWVKICKNGNF